MTKVYFRIVVSKDDHTARAIVAVGITVVNLEIEGARVSTIARVATTAEPVIRGNSNSTYDFKPFLFFRSL